MKRVILLSLLICMPIIVSCAGDEVPDICGLYSGTRVAQYGYGGEFYVDIMRCNEDGIAGETEFVNGTSYTVKSFEGEWSDGGDTVTITFNETAVLQNAGTCGDTMMYFYNAEINRRDLAGTYMIGSRYYGSISLKRVDATVTK